jgi:hypothetical protein
MRQCVAPRGDEGWFTRLLTAEVCLTLLTIIDALIDLLARFRAGTLPPVLPARDRSAVPADGRPGDQRAARSPADPAASSGRIAAAPRIRAAGAVPASDGGEAPEQPATPNHPRGGTQPRRRPAATTLTRSRQRHRPPGHGPRCIAGDPPHVPRSPFRKIGVRTTPPTHVKFVT